MINLICILEKNDLFQQLESERATSLEAEERYTRLGKLFSLFRTSINITH
jgi:hypothetical protein